MDKIEHTLTSMEVAEMVNKDHAMLLRDLRRYMAQFNECNIAVVDFFQESTYEDRKGEPRPCYRITKKGCEFIAHKLTGQKGLMEELVKTENFLSLSIDFLTFIKYIVLSDIQKVR